jgi:hypothetical protein
MKDYSIQIISTYKFLGAFIRLLIGILILSFRGNLHNFILFIFKKEILEDPTDLFSSYLLGHIAQSSAFLTFLLALALIIFSLLEIIFAINLFLQKKSGAMGLFVISILWIPIEFLFISKFLLAPKTIGLVLDIIILILLFQMIIHSRKYFKK